MKKVAIFGVTILSLFFGATAIASTIIRAMSRTDRNRVHRINRQDLHRKPIHNRTPDPHKLRPDHSRHTGAPITGACKPMGQPTGVSITAAFRSTRGRCEQDLW